MSNTCWQNDPDTPGMKRLRRWGAHDVKYAVSCRVRFQPEGGSDDRLQTSGMIWVIMAHTHTERETETERQRRCLLFHVKSPTDCSHRRRSGCNNIQYWWKKNNKMICKIKRKHNLIKRGRKRWREGEVKKMAESLWPSRLKTIGRGQSIPGSRSVQTIRGLA